MVQCGEIVEREGDVGMLGAERLFSDRQRTLVERLGLRVGAGGTVQLGEIVERAGGVGMLGAERLLTDRQRALRKWNGLLVPPRCIVLQNLPVQALRFGEVAFLRACRGQDQEREQEERNDAPFVQPTPAPTLHRDFPFNQ